ncbi:MAG: P-II family nitrogen regulator [Oscillospiraceae bacterium]|nr:P-II family nitrogen regulator [Oscillospiraceae bacterium]
MPKYELLCCVVNDGAASKTLKIAKKYGIKGGTVSIGHGTVKSRLLHVLGIYDVRKEVITMIADKESVSEAIKGISNEMEFHKPHHGIAFTIPVAEFFRGKNETTNHPVISEEKEVVYNIIYVIVDKGKAEDVIEASNKAGAQGGTIINARGAGVHEVQKLFSVEIEPEKEEVFIITKTELKDGIVESVRTHLKIDEPGNGILFVMDVDEVYGLH